MNYKNRIQGARARRTGELWEKGLDAIFARIAARGHAYIQKTPEPMKVLASSRDGHIFPAVFTAKAQPDYTGTLAGGRSVMIEAKSTQGDRITSDRIQPVQANTLDAHHQLGAVCGVLVSINFETYGFIPWQDWQQLKAKTGHKYVNAADLQANGWELPGNDISAALAERLITEANRKEATA